MSFDKIRDASNFILDLLKKKRIDGDAKLAVILGSGLGGFAGAVENILKIPYKTIPAFPVSTVQGHEGALVLAKNKDTDRYFWIMQGRVHFYEGYSMDQVVFPVRVLAMLGVEKLLVTNAAGGVNKYFEPGDLMLIKDHINLLGTNPLIGPNINELGVRFPDMSKAYSARLTAVIRDTAREQGVTMKEGVYCALTGPSFETPAEIKMLTILGVDAVGMSTVPEVIIARHCGIEVAGISFISNKAAGISAQELSHEEVGENARAVEEKFSGLVKAAITKILGIL